MKTLDFYRVVPMSFAFTVASDTFFVGNIQLFGKIIDNNMAHQWDSAERYLRIAPFPIVPRSPSDCARHDVGESSSDRYHQGENNDQVVLKMGYYCIYNYPQKLDSTLRWISCWQNATLKPQRLRVR
jgi:hypothetical protein